jgi:hypothetical protein
VHETDEEHLQRHTGVVRRSCARCIFLTRRAELERVATSRTGIRWLCPRPTFLGGTWALGCCICAAAHKHPEIRDARRARSARCKRHQTFGRAGAKWARREIRRPLGVRNGGASALLCHSLGQAHVEALSSLDCADNHLRFAKVVHIDEGTSVGEQAFKGRVPKPAMWKTAWVESTSCLSFNKQESLTIKRGEVRAGACVRKQRKKQVQVMAEGGRERARKRMREASSFCISMDDGKARKILRVRCDQATPPYSFGGVVGLVEPGYASLDEILEDHGQLSVGKLRDFFHSFFYPVGLRRL